MSDEKEELQQLQPDFSEAVDFSPFPDGTFRCRVVGIRGFLSKGAEGRAKLPMVEFKFEIESDIKYKTAEGEERSTKGRMLFRNFPCAGAGTGFLQAALTGMKYSWKNFRLPDSKIELLGRAVLITTKLDSGMSPARNKPETFAPAT